MYASIRWIARRDAPLAAEALLRFDPAEFIPALKTRLLILQPTPFCNLRCDYCYLPHRDDKARMSLDTVRASVRRLAEAGLLGDSLTVVWHAGEPLAVPPDFYEAAIAACTEAAGPQCELSHSIQTNAVLIDDAWCRLFKRHRIRVGVSVDGPAAMHDLHRRTRNGHGTHGRVLSGMAKLRDHGIEFHAIAVVTADTLPHARDFARFFVEQGVREVGCNFDEAEGLHGESSLGGAEERHEAFLAELMACASDDASPLRVREFIYAAHLIGEGLPRYQWRGEALPFNAQVVPFALVNVAWNGDCGTFSPELLGQPSGAFDFTLGNVHRDALLACASRPGFRRLWSAIARGTRTCEGGCSHFDYCGGGAPVNKWYENGDLASGETLYCRSMVKRPFDLVLRAMEEKAGVVPAQAVA